MGKIYECQRARARKKRFLSFIVLQSHCFADRNVFYLILNVRSVRSTGISVRSILSI